MGKKTRSRTNTPVVSRRIKRQRRRHRDLKKNARDPILKQIWDNKESIRQNMKALTLDHLVTASGFAEEHTLSLARLSGQDNKICRSLINKYKEDYEGMSRDRKLNFWQWTPVKCRRQIKICEREGMKTASE